MSDKANSNEYRVYETNGAEYSVYGAKYTLKKNVATFWYWRKNLDQRWELVSFERKGVKSVSLVIGDPGETGYGFQAAPWDGWKTILLFLVFLLAACNPYQTTPAPTATATGTATPAMRTIVPMPTPTPQTCTVTTGVPDGTLNIRTGEGTSYAVIGTLKEGQQLTIIQAGKWLKVSTRTTTGFINSSYCRMEITK